ncbi:ABC transporter permease subunit [Micromonospora halophytica]|uniref:ABC-2 family transporter protein n=1 Tax=Micromonospora halophytica TaxID=47864 RepID=A0A1C5IUW5_9ACTN|nr:ABC transporter permease subunit [Micromonospora halophytica]SCG61536.1 ABC-2 family transporter protein [Micromonospora halophytica]
MSLYVTELRRLAKRRLTRMLLALLVVGLAGIATVFAFSSHKLSPAVVAQAQAESDAQYRQAVQGWQKSVAECEAAQARGEQTEERYGPNCGRDWQPQPEMFDPTWNLPYQFDFRAEFGIFVAVFAGAVGLFAFLVGASFVGAEWSTGGMMNLLLWRPRRLAVLGTKLAAVLTTLVGVTVVLGALWTLAFWLIGTWRGTTARVTAGVWQSVGLDGLRALALILAVGAVAFALASIGRHTAMALGVAVGLGVVSEIGVRIGTAIAGVPFGDRYVLSTYAMAWFQKRWKLVDYDSCQFVQGACEPKEMFVTWQQSGLLFGLGAALVLTAAFWLMRRRDVA